jgi:hypothetical protein
MSRIDPAFPAKKRDLKTPKSPLTLKSMKHGVIVRKTFLSGSNATQGRGRRTLGFASFLLGFCLILVAGQARANEGRLAEARRQYFTESLRSPGNREVAKKASRNLGQARAEAKKDAARALLKNVSNERKKQARGTFDRLKKFFTGAGIFSETWFQPGPSDVAAGSSRSFGAGTSGKAVGGKPASPSAPSGPALQYNGPRSYQFGGSGSELDGSVE